MDRQIECLLFHLFTVVPSLGPQPTSTKPWFRSRVGGGAGDGTPIGYSWRWGVGDGTPYIRNFVEPIGTLTGMPADAFNEVATKEFLCKLGKVLPEADLSLFWKFGPHLRPNLVDEVIKQKSSMLVGLQMTPESHTIDLMAYLYPQVPVVASELLSKIMPKAMRDAYGADVCLDSLNVVCEFMATDPDGIQLIPRGTTGIDCCRPQDARVKCYVATRNTSFDHIAAIMTLGGRNPVPTEMMEQLRELWYTLRGLEANFPTSAQLPSTDENIATNGGSPPGSYLLPFYFDIQPGNAKPGVKAYFEAGNHCKSDMAVAEVITKFLERHGRGRHTKSFVNVLQGIVPVEELQTRRGIQAFISVAFKKGELDITSYFNPHIYRRFNEFKSELEETTVVTQRRSLFE